MDEYIQSLQAIMASLVARNRQSLTQVVELIAESFRKDGLLHIFGPGHSHMVAEEAFNRRGGIVLVNPIVDRVGGPAEQLPGYARVLLDSYDVRNGEVMIIVSTTGVNCLPVEMATGAKERGLHTVAITSREFSGKLQPRNPHGVHLMDVVDVVLDTGVPFGDAGVTIPGLGMAVGATSSVAATAVLNGLLVEVAKAMWGRGDVPPVLLPPDHPTAAPHNMRLRNLLRSRVPSRHTAMLFW